MINQAATQVRLHHERACAVLFERIWNALGRCPVTLLTFDYGGGEYGSVEFKTSLALTTLVATLEGLIASWCTGRPRVIEREAVEALGLPEDAGTLLGCGDFLKESLPEGRGYALLLGRGEVAQYIASGAREDMIRMFETELLPNWRAAATSEGN